MKKLSIIAILVCIQSFVYAQKANLNDYVGVFKVEGAPFEKITITNENNALMADVEGIGKSQIAETTVKDEFKEAAHEATIGFKRDSAMTVNAIYIKAQGMEFGGKKQMADLSEFAGTYKFEDGSPVAEVKVEYKNGVLVGNSVQGASVLKPNGKKDSFDLVDFGGTAMFARDSTSNQVTNVVIEVQGMTLKGKK